MKLMWNHSEWLRLWPEASQLEAGGGQSGRALGLAQVRTRDIGWAVAAHL